MPPSDISALNDLRAALRAAEQRVAAVGRDMDLLRQATLVSADPSGSAALQAAADQVAQDRSEINRLAAEIDTAAVAAFASPDALMQAVSPDHPIAMLPVRIETRFDDVRTLRLRVYPDQIHIHSLRAEVTAAEVSAAQAYWTTVWTDLGQADAAWSALAASLGPERAKYLADLLQPSGFGGHDPTAAISFPDVQAQSKAAAPRPEARLLPSRWHVSAQDQHGGILAQAWFPNPVAARLPVSPIGDLLDLGAWDGTGALAPDDPALWLTDYDKAVAAGMAMTLQPVPGRDFGQGIARLVVVGVDFSRTPAAGAADLANHLTDHGHSDGFGLVAPGVATNNTGAGPANYRGANRDRAATLAAAGTVAAPAADLARLLAALGMADRTPAFGGFPQADLACETTVEAMHTALWGSTFGFYLGHILAPLVPFGTIREIRRFVRDHVRPAGPFATVRIGRQPYGVLPIIPRYAGRLPDSEELRHGFPRALSQMLARMRVQVEFGDVTGPGGQTLSLRPLDTIPSLVTDQPGKTPAEVLADILKMGPMAARAFVRPTLGADVLANASDTLELAIRHHRDVATIFLANLGFPPSQLALLGQTLPLLDMVVQKFPRFHLRNLPWVAADLDAPGSMAAPIAAMQARIAAAAAQGATADTVLAISADEAGSLFEGLLMLSGAFEYWDAGERHLRDFAVAATLPTEGLLLSQPLLAMDPRQADAAASRTIDTPRQMLGLQASHITGDATLFAFLDSNAVGEDPLPATRDIAAFRAALDVLATRPAREVDHALRGLLDLGSHRLDAFITGDATRRLSAKRAQHPDGISIGGYGIVHDLMVEQSPDSEGYVHLPTLDHAVTASVLRAGHMAYRDEDPQAFAVRLTSDRVRNAIQISDGMARGQQPSALIGYRLERWLVEDRLRAKFVLPLRRVAPHPADSAPADAAQESIAPRDVVDGVAIARHWMSAPDALLADMAAARGTPTSTEDEAALRGHFDRTVDLLDSFGDMWTTEAVHQLVRGNAARAAAAMAVIDRQEKPADPQAMLTPRSAWGYAQRVMWIADPLQAAAWPEDAVARASPGANAIIAALLGPPARFVLALRGLDVDGAVLPDRLTLTLTEAGVSPLTLMMLSGSKTDGAATRLEERLAAAAFAAHPGLNAAGLQFEAAPPTDAGPQVQGYGALRAALGTVRRALAGRRPLGLRDFVIPDGATGDSWRVEDLAMRSAALNTNLTTIADDIAQGLVRDEAAGDWLGDATRVLKGLRAAAELTMPVPAWALMDAGGGVPPQVLAETGRAALAGIQRLLDSWNQHGQDDPAEAEIARLRAVFGRDFPVLPDLDLPEPTRAAWSLSLADQPALQGAPGPGVLARWRRAMAMVRPQMRALMAALDGGVWTGHIAADQQGVIAQFPHRPGTRWVGLPFADPDQAAKEHPTVALAAVVFGPALPPGPLCGVMIDEWTEAIPERSTATSLSFHYDAPGTRPPQAILLAVDPGDGVNAWSVPVLTGIANEALDLARLRLLDPGAIPGGGAVLPTVFLPTNLAHEAPTWDFLHHLGLQASILGKG